ncbi:MAG: hypothetical protein ISS19_08890 [Bacteroidales bacterium]|nr:hypothetical protein [Bacteroidales bacterium]
MIFLRSGFFTLIVFMVAFFSCKDAPKEQDNAFSVEINEKLDSTPAEPRAIFYHMLLPVEMAHLFDQVGANYYPDILNPSDNLSRYDTPVKVALNLGVYGADLSYVKMFQRKDHSVKYLSAIHSMSAELEIPGQYYDDLLDNLEEYVSNKDSLAKISVTLFKTVDEYLRSTGNGSAAALIMMGGWVESLYISTQIYYNDQQNIKLLEKIAEQKYSLNSLISLMSNYHSEQEITEYLLMLKNLRRSYDKFEIYYKVEDVDVDTINKKISASKYYINASPEQILEISDKLAALRERIIR